MGSPGNRMGGELLIHPFPPCFPFNLKRFKIEVTYYLVFVFSLLACSLPHFSKVPGFDYGCISDLADCNNERETHFIS